MAVSSQLLVGTQPRSHEHIWFVSGPAGGLGTQGQPTKQNINLKGNSTENVEVTQNGSTAKGQQNRHIIKKGNRLEADLSGTQPHHNSSTVLGSILHSTSYGQIRQIVPEKYCHFSIDNTFARSSQNRIAFNRVQSTQRHDSCKFRSNRLTSASRFAQSNRNSAYCTVHTCCLKAGAYQTSTPSLSTNTPTFVNLTQSKQAQRNS